MQTAYASFSSHYNQDARNLREATDAALEQAAYQMGRAWGLKGNTKLPFDITIGDYWTRVIKSTDLKAKAFIRGWKETRPTK